MSRIISVDTGSLTKLKNVYEALDYIAEAGLKYFDLSLYWYDACDKLCVREDYAEETMRLKAHADKLGLKCNQSHTYFTVGTDAKAIEVRKQLISQGIRVSKMMGAKLTIVHPIWELSMEENVQFLKYFEPLLKELDFKIAIENVWGVTDEHPSIMCSSTPKGINKLLDQLDERYYCACLDIGHAEMKRLETSAIDMIKSLGPRLQALHIHDNDQSADLHQIPYTYNIDFDAIFECLRENNYQGDITFEVERCYCHFPVDVYIEALRLLHAIGKYFEKILDKKD